MAFSILDARLNNDLVEMIAIKIHQESFKDMMTPIHNALVPIEKALKENDPFSALQIKYKPSIHVDEYIDWITVVMQFHNERILIWHHYVDGPDQDEILVDGFVENGLFKIEKFMYVNSYTGHQYDLELYIKTRSTVQNQIPFQFMSRKLFGIDEMQIAYDYNSGKKWMNPEKICKWFKDMDWSAFTEEEM